MYIKILDQSVEIIRKLHNPDKDAANDVEEFNKGILEDEINIKTSSNDKL